MGCVCVCEYMVYLCTHTQTHAHCLPDTRSGVTWGSTGRCEEIHLRGKLGEVAGRRSWGASE